LDTSAIVPWLKERGYEVHAVLVDVGQKEDQPALCQKALDIGAKTAVIRDAKPAMFQAAVPLAIGLQATYEGTYRLGTALARPFIALEQIRVAKQLGGATLVHGATGKGNDQIRFEFAYRTLAPECPVLAPWKTWQFEGRQDLVDYLQSKGIEGDYATTKDYSLDENLWHLSVEGGPLEDATASIDVGKILGAVANRFAGGARSDQGPATITLGFESGVPVSVDGSSSPLPDLVARLNGEYRSAAWAWDLVIENRFTGIKSRGLYINPAAKLLYLAVDALARTCLNKPLYDRYTALGQEYGAMLYRGEYFSEQRLVLEAAARQILKHLSGTVTVQLTPTPYVARVNAPRAIFTKSAATFEKSDYSHAHAEGFIRLTWLSSIGQSLGVDGYADVVETGHAASSDVRLAKQVSGGGLVPSSA
jgi:argininosuccinate synthase